MKRTLAVLAFALLMSSCVQLGSVWQNITGSFRGSDTDEASEKVFSAITPEQEYIIGRAVAANILSSYKIQTNTPALTAYVNRICNALIVNSRRPEIFNGYHVAILDSDEINAFATPGGHIFITRGLIECTTSEDVLAAVIAHEIAHIQLEHGLKAIRNNRFTQIVLDAADSAVSGAAGLFKISERADTLKVSVKEIASSMMNNGYSKIQEFEADSDALNLLARAGYAPSSLIEMLRVLEKNQPDVKGGFNNTHPDPAERIRNIQRHSRSFRVPDTRSHRKDRYSSFL